MRIGPEGMTEQGAIVQHRPEIDAARLDRIARGQPLDQPFDGQIEQRFGAFDADPGAIGLCAAGGIQRAGCGDLLPAHRGGGAEQAGGGGRAHQRRDLRAAARLAEHHHPAGIAAERRDVAADPAQRQDQIELPGIAAVGKPIRQAGKIEIAERVQPVIDRHDDDVARRRERPAVILGIDDAAVRIGAAVDIDHHRAAGARVRPGRPDIEEQAILAGGADPAGLRRGRREAGGIGDIAIGQRRAGRLKPGRARVLSVPDAAKAVHMAIDHAPPAAGRGADDAVARRGHDGNVRRKPGEPGGQNGAACGHD